MKTILYLTFFLTAFTTCKVEKFESDNRISGYPEAAIETLREAPYPMGAAITMGALRDNETYRQTVIKEMSSITAENAMKMNFISTGRGEYFWDDADYLIDFAVQNDIRIHGHTLLWYRHTPDWVSGFSGTKEEWIAIMREYIQTVVGRYRGKIASWDVLNEIILDDGSLRPSVWLTNIGQEYIGLAYQFAHEADPNALLFYNDYGHEYSHNRRLATKQLADSLVDAGVPIHGIGLQMHTNTNRSINDLRYAIMSAATTKLLIHVSELDVAVNPDQNPNATFTEALAIRQQEAYRAVAQAMLDLPEEQQFGITFWGVSDANSFMRDNPDWPLVFDSNYQRKTAYRGLLQGIYRKGDKMVPVSLDQASLNLFSDAQVEIAISGGMSPYVVSENSNPAAATAVIKGTKLVITGTTEGTTNIAVTGEDGSSAQLLVTVKRTPNLITFEQLKANLSSQESIILPDDIKIKGIVISDNKSRNIDNKTIVLQEDNNKGGLFIEMTGEADLNIGDEVEVIVSQRTLAKVYDEFTLKDIPTDHIQKLGDKIIIPNETTIDQILANKKDWTGTLVKLGSGSFSGGNGKYTGILEYTNASGAVKSMIRQNATFAGNDYPEQVDNLIGIIRSEGGDIRLDIRNTDDVMGKVRPHTFILDNFESGVKDIKFRGGPDAAVVEVVNNPLKSGLNTSDKVLMVTKSFASQQLNIYIRRASNPTVDISDEVWGKNFNRVRFMYYNPITSGRFVSWKYNGQDPTLNITPQPEFGVWSYVDIAVTPNQMDALTSIHLRLNDGGNSDNDVVYIDNIEFYNAELMEEWMGQ